jgi:hypothetical protein
MLGKCSTTELYPQLYFEFSAVKLKRKYASDYGDNDHKPPGDVLAFL